MNIRRIAIALLVLVAAWLSWPQSADPDLARVEANGYRAARHVASHRQLAAVALARRDSAIVKSNIMFRKAIDRVSSAATQAGTFVAPEWGTVVPDSGSPAIVGRPQPGDTLVPLPMVRERLRWLADTANVVIADLQATVMLERGRSSLAIQHFAAALVAQDTVLSSLKLQLSAARVPWYRRAVGGVVHAGAGLACGTAGYVLGGLPAGLGAGVLCAAAAAVFR